MPSAILGGIEYVIEPPKKHLHKDLPAIATAAFPDLSNMELVAAILGSG